MGCVTIFCWWFSELLESVAYAHSCWMPSCGVSGQTGGAVTNGLYPPEDSPDQANSKPSLGCVLPFSASVARCNLVLVLVVGMECSSSVPDQLQCNTTHVFSDVSPTLLNKAYSQVRVCRIVASVHNTGTHLDENNRIKTFQAVLPLYTLPFLSIEIL